MMIINKSHIWGSVNVDNFDRLSGSLNHIKSKPWFINSLRNPDEMIHTTQSSRFTYKSRFKIFTCNGRYPGSRTETGYCLGQWFSKITWEWLMAQPHIHRFWFSRFRVGCSICTSNKYHNYFDGHQNWKIVSLWLTFG